MLIADSLSPCVSVQHDSIEHVHRLTGLKHVATFFFRSIGIDLQKMLHTYRIVSKEAVGSNVPISSPPKTLGMDEDRNPVFLFCVDCCFSSIVDPVGWLSPRFPIRQAAAIKDMSAGFVDLHRLRYTDGKHPFFGISEMDRVLGGRVGVFENVLTVDDAFIRRTGNRVFAMLLEKRLGFKGLPNVASLNRCRSGRLSRVDDFRMHHFAVVFAFSPKVDIVHFAKRHPQRAVVRVIVSFIRAVWNHRVFTRHS